MMPKRPNLVSVLLVAALTVFPAGVSAQSVGAVPPAPASPPGPDLLQGLIRLDVVVTDRAGRPVAGLGPGNFTILDNGQPQKMLSFAAFQGAAQPDPPTSVLVLLDTINVPGTVRALEYQQVKAFLRQNGGRMTHRISLLMLNEGGLWLVSDASSDGNLLASDLEHNRFMRQIRPGEITLNLPLAGWDDRSPGMHPVTAALQALGAIATEQRQRPGRKLLLWVGPAWNAGTGRNPDDVLTNASLQRRFFDRIVWFSTLLRDARITLDSFSAGVSASLYLEGGSPGFGSELGPPTSSSDVPNLPSSPQEIQRRDLSRSMLALESGGRILPPATDLVGQLNACMREANTFYTLSFNPPPALRVADYHQLIIRLDSSALVARTNAGYYDQPWFADPPNPAVQRVGVAQFEELLGSLRSESDADAARRLSGLRLTERLSSAKLTQWTTQLRGNKARQALTAIADLSSFLDPPPDEIPTDPAPDQTAQQQIIARASSYLNQTMSRLPDFFAQRSGLVYVETPPHYDGSTLTSPAEPLHVIDNFRNTAIYRDGGEVVDAKSKQRMDRNGFLSTFGTFGPVLIALKDALAHPENLRWSHWENDPSGRSAVFRFAIPAAHSRYWTDGCCLPDGDGKLGFEKRTGYHGEISIDAASGAILRVATQADLTGFVPLDRSGILVVYGPVVIDGKTWICPLRSVGLLRSRTVDTWQEWDESFKTWGPWITMLNDFSFGDYHMFRAKSRILPGTALQ